MRICEYVKCGTKPKVCGIVYYRWWLWDWNVERPMSNFEVDAPHSIAQHQPRRGDIIIGRRILEDRNPEGVILFSRAEDNQISKS